MTSTERAKLRQQLVAQFNDEELKTLAFDLGLNHDSLPCQDRGTLARELLAACEREERLDDLRDAIARARPAMSATKAAMPSQKAAAGRKRGGQPNNANALKHGLYARHFRTDELSDVSAAMRNGLDDEIAMLRVVMSRVLNLAHDAEDLATLQELLGSLGVASTRLSGLLKTQRLLAGDHNETANAITQAIAAVVKEFCLA